MWMKVPARLERTEQVLREIEEASRRQFLPIVGPEKGRLLEALVRHIQPLRVLEVGTLVGYSAILMAQHMPPASKLWTLEVHPHAAHAARENVLRTGLADRIEVILGDARETIPSVSGPLDLVFLDATKEQYLEYLHLAETSLRAGGVVVADNAGVFREAMAPYLDYVRRSGKYLSRYYDFGFDGIEVSYRLPVAKPFFPTPQSVGSAG